MDPDGPTKTLRKLPVPGPAVDCNHLQLWPTVTHWVLIRTLQTMPYRPFSLLHCPFLLPEEAPSVEGGG